MTEPKDPPGGAERDADANEGGGASKKKNGQVNPGDPRDSNDNDRAPMWHRIVAWAKRLLAVYVGLYAVSVSVRVWCWLWADTDRQRGIWGASPPTWSEFGTILSHISWPLVVLVAVLAISPMLPRLMTALEKRRWKTPWLEVNDEVVPSPHESAGKPKDVERVEEVEGV